MSRPLHIHNGKDLRILQGAMKTPMSTRQQELLAKKANFQSMISCILDEMGNHFEGDVASLEENVAALESDIASLEGDNQALRDTVKQLLIEKEVIKRESEDMRVSFQETTARLEERLKEAMEKIDAARFDSQREQMDLRNAYFETEINLLAEMERLKEQSEDDSKTLRQTRASLTASIYESRKLSGEQEKLKLRIEALESENRKLKAKIQLHLDRPTTPLPMDADGDWSSGDLGSEAYEKYIFIDKGRIGNNRLPKSSGEDGNPSKLLNKIIASGRDHERDRDRNDGMSLAIGSGRGK
ncbi:hypothetical protein DRE_04649 [Drechslerella stenobrocha 248]|uniref:Uncharacterized protein n=1 Tax=Drechslerella stenobrocha 248 TaxID=1043628 RepID=W7IAJ7_9PEZI|nr:hypothetical protein DRE_04649 [Drechslerella stenobrocha 248]